MSWPAAVLWVVFLAAALSRGPALFYVLNLVGVFGSLQMLPGEGAGSTLLPQAVCAAILIAKVFVQRGNLARGLALALDPGRVGLFAAFFLYALLTAFVLPRLFAGQIEVVPVSGVLSGTSILGPSSGNITQTGYLVLSFGTTMALAVIGSERVLRHYFLSMLATGLLLVVTGLVDLAFYRVGLSGLLDPFRTASYALLTDVEAAGAKRVVGLMPEASVYGATCVNLAATLLFLRPWLAARREQLPVVLTVLLLVGMAALSTSSTGYVGLVVFGAVYGLDLLLRWRSGVAALSAGAGSEIMALSLAGAAAVGFVVLRSDLLGPVWDLLDKVLFDKTSSASFAERSTWTAVGVQALFDSAGLGVGLGSVRTSNWFVSILSSTGLFGGALIFGFIVWLFVAAPARRDPRTVGLVRAFRFILVPNLAMDALAGTIPDIGVGAAAVFGLIVTLTWRPAGRPRLPVAAGARVAPAAPLPPVEVPGRVPAEAESV